MRDQQSLERCQKLHPKVRQEVIDTITEVEQGFPSNIKVRVVQGLRTFEEQNQLYALGRTKVNPDGKTASRPMGRTVTKAIGGKSNHNYGLAIDYALLYDNNGDGTFEELSWSLVKDGDKDGIKDWDEVKNAFIARGYSWGGSWRTFTDNPHIEKTFGFKVSELLAKYNAGDFIPGTKYLNI
jgi:peptidoglycan LD-endopeptidase CwlK